MNAIKYKLFLRPSRVPRVPLLTQRRLVWKTKSNTIMFRPREHQSVCKVSPPPNRRPLPLSLPPCPRRLSIDCPCSVRLTSESAFCDASCVTTGSAPRSLPGLILRHHATPPHPPAPLPPPPAPPLILWALCSAVRVNEAKGSRRVVRSVVSRRRQPLTRSGTE